MIFYFGKAIIKFFSLITQYPDPGDKSEFKSKKKTPEGALFLKKK